VSFIYSFVFCENELDCLMTFFSFKTKGAAYIVTSYADSLKKEHTWRSGPGVAPLRDASGSKYVHVEQQDHDHSTNVPLNNVPYSSYPYNNTSNSFGGTTHHHHTATPV
jgi:hypothetical protein